jgi:hypothetical protein
LKNYEDGAFAGFCTTVSGLSSPYYPAKKNNVTTSSSSEVAEEDAN